MFVQLFGGRSNGQTYLWPGMQDKIVVKDQIYERVALDVALWFGERPRRRPAKQPS